MKRTLMILALVLAGCNNDATQPSSGAPADSTWTTDPMSTGPNCELAGPWNCRTSGGMNLCTTPCGGRVDYYELDEGGYVCQWVDANGIPHSQYCTPNGKPSVWEPTKKRTHG